MAKHFEELDESHRKFISAQKLWFVATAPLAGDGHVNLSPKGHDSFRMLGPREVAYLDLNGSGAETIAHLRENGRITLLFCAFEGAPKIVRIYGRGEACLAGTPQFEALAPHFEQRELARSIIRVDIERVGQSCGYGIPLYDYQEDRETLLRWTESKNEDEILAFQKKHNRRSVDGLPALDLEG